MFVCGDCGAVFEKPANRVETIWTKGRSEQYVLAGAPNAGAAILKRGLNAECAAK